MRLEKREKSASQQFTSTSPFGRFVGPRLGVGSRARVIKGTGLLMTFSVKAVGLVHHWDGSFDGAAALTASKERVPADGTRSVQAK